MDDPNKEMPTIDIPPKINVLGTKPSPNIKVEKEINPVIEKQEEAITNESQATPETPASAPEPVPTVPETSGVTFTPSAPESASAPAELPGNPAEAAKRFGIDSYSNSRADQQYAPTPDIVTPPDSAPAATPTAAPEIPQAAPVADSAPKTGMFGGIFGRIFGKK